VEVISFLGIFLGSGSATLLSEIIGNIFANHQNLSRKLSEPFETLQRSVPACVVDLIVPTSAWVVTFGFQIPVCLCISYRTGNR
jgi:hypothetical protein